MTPLEAAKLADQCYTDNPTIGEKCSASRAVIYGNAIAFPGTDNVACFLADLDAVAFDCPDFGRVHTGFHDAWEKIADQVLKNPVEIVIGHSLGAAIALFCAASLCRIGKPPKQVFAFEPPRVSCDDSLRKIFEAYPVELHLFRNGLDVVPLVPRLLEDWVHPGDLNFIGKPIVPFPNIEDHLMKNVIASLQSMK